MESRYCAHLDIQQDWDAAVREGATKVWVTLKRPGQRSLHGNLYLGKKDTGSVLQESEFQVTEESKHCMEVVHNPSDVSSRFIAPTKCFRLHHKKLCDMDLSSSGGLGMASSVDGKVWVWDTDTGEKRRTLEGHVSEVTTCKFFPSGVVALTGGSDFQLKIWSVETGSCPRTLTGHTRGITDTALVEKGRNVVSVSDDGTARLWECGSGQCVRTLWNTKQSPLTSCAMATSPLAPSNTQDGELEFGVDGKLLAVTADNGTLVVLSVAGKNEVMQKQFGSGLTSCAFSSETSVMCGASDGQIIEVDLRNIRTRLRTVMTSSEVTSLKMADERKCITGTADGSCFIWDIQEPNATAVVKLTGPQDDRVTAICNHGNNVWTSCRDGCVRAYTLI